MSAPPVPPMTEDDLLKFAVELVHGGLAIARDVPVRVVLFVHIAPDHYRLRTCGASEDDLLSIDGIPRDSDVSEACDTPAR